MTTIIQDLTSRQQAFLQPTIELNTTVLNLGKRFFDPLASDVSASQIGRLKLERQSKKRKRDDHEEPLELLRMQQLYTDGFDVEQVWQQSKRVLDATLREVVKEVPNQKIHTDALEVEPDPKRRKEVRFEDGADSDSLGEEGVDWQYDGDDVESGDELDGEVGEKVDSASDEGSPDLGEDTPASDVSEDEQPTEELVKDRHGLNDGFFSIDHFNKNTQFLENVDARGDHDDGAASDEEDIDWDADPLAEGVSIGMGKVETSDRASGQNDEDEDGDGPTFGDVDLDAPDTDDEEMDEGIESEPMGDFSNTNEIMYNDFFAPPAGSKSRQPRQHPLRERHRRETNPNPKGSISEIATEYDAMEDEGDAEMDRAMSSVRRDLVDDEKDDEDLEQDEENEAAQSNQNLSTHERRMAEFRKEIARLERENVASKPWALTGETVAPARPENALLEEDLEFERAGKPLPVITQEVNESIEELIKRRILNSEFDEVPRRRPELDNLNGSVRRGILDAHGRREELSDTKPQHGLAEEYEDDYLRKTDPNYVDQRSEVTKKKHAEIEKQWTELRGQLDALCNWHYKPRPPEKNLEVRTHAPVVQIEEARPAAETSGNASGLAPQEVYKPGQDGKVLGEVRTKGGTAVSKEEETRESKKRRRRRNKEKAHKAGGNADSRQSSNQQAPEAKQGKAKKREDREEVVKTLKQGNVKVIGKKGELQDVEGKAASTNAHGGRSGVAGYVL